MKDVSSHLATGVPGFDSVSHGGLPRGRISVVIGAAGAGKTIFALQTLAYRMNEFDEHTIFVTFEQPVDHVVSDIDGFDWNFRELAATRLTLIDAGIRPDVVRNGQFSLDGLIAGLTALTAQTGATVVVLDGIDALLSMLANEELERQELGRVIGWLRDADVTGIVTVKASGNSSRSRSRSEYLGYQSDCVIVLDTLRLSTQVSRTLCIQKFRGSDFNGDVLPVVIDKRGVAIFGTESAAVGATLLEIESERISTGLDELDELLEGGYLKGSTTLISGSPGTAKSTLSTAFLVAAARSGRKAVYVSFDETERQVATHMSSVGFDVRPLVAAGHIQVLSMQANVLPPEAHVAMILGIVEEFGAEVLVIDPISAVMKSDHPFAQRVTEYLILELRRRRVTMVCTSLLESFSGAAETTLSHVSTVADTWIHVSYHAQGGERNRALTIVKSRGTAHSNQVRELQLSNSGVALGPVYTSEGEVLLGSARLQKEAYDRRVAADLAAEQDRRAIAAADELDALGQQLARLTAEIGRKRHEMAVAAEFRSTSSEVRETDRADRVSARSRGLDSVVATDFGEGGDPQ